MRIRTGILSLSAWLLIGLSACDRQDAPDKGQGDESEDVSSVYGVPIDFSNVGYRQGERSLPAYPTEIELEAPSDGADATALIQNALDKVLPKGAVLLKAGLYNVSGQIKIHRHDIVLRGEGEGTVIKATGTSTRTLIALGRSTECELSGRVKVLDDFVPAGRKWARVENPSSFSPGDRVALYFQPNDAWISDLQMDRIPQNASGTVEQWKKENFIQRWERNIVKVEGEKVWFDAPVVMELHSKYAEDISLWHLRWERTEESGVEDLMLVSGYDENDDEDEVHSKNAIDVTCAENCWIRNVRSAHFSHSLVKFRTGARQVTVKDCVSTDPVSKITGGRRYAFFNDAGELCLVESCEAWHDRHGFVTGAKTPGPNVYLDCVMKNAYSDMGPHQRWATGVLFDNCDTDLRIEVRDRGNSGTGHGWTGVSIVYWNCEAGRSIICRSPWVNGKNWCVGCIGSKYSGVEASSGLGGEWYSHGEHVEPVSLYRYQLEKRLNGSQL